MAVTAKDVQALRQATGAGMMDCKKALEENDGDMEAAKQWLKDLYQDNKLIKGELELGGRKVDLAQLTMPVLNIYAQDDHIIPPPTSRALAGKIGTDDYTELGLPGGHIGVFVSGKDFSWMGPLLFVGSMLALGLVLAAVLFGFNLGLVFAVVMVGLAAGYIIHDPSNVMNRYGPTGPVARHGTGLSGAP